MPFVVLAVISAVLAVISLGLGIYAALQTPPDPPVPSPKEVENMPEAEQGSPIPVVFGVRTIRKSNVIWWGDTFNKPNKIQP